MKKVLSLLVVAVLLVSTFGAMAYAVEELTYGIVLQELDIISGDKEGNLNGDKAITRGELIAIIHNLTTESSEQFIVPSTASFSDVPQSHWAYYFIERAKANNVTQGVGNGRFGVKDEVTYKQARAFMLNMLGYTIEWNAVEAYADELGIYCNAAENSTTFTRDMMFEILWKSLVAPTTQYKNFIHAVLDRAYLDLDSTDIKFLSDSNIMFLEREATPLNLTVEDFIFSESNYNLHEQVPAMFDEHILSFGRYNAKYYYNLFNNVTYSPSTTKVFYNSYKTFELKGSSDFVAFVDNIYLRDDATENNNLYFIEYLEDGSVTMEVPVPSSINFEKTTLNVDSVWMSDGHPRNTNLKSFVVNLSHPSDKSIVLKLVYLFDYKSFYSYRKLVIYD